MRVSKMIPNPEWLASDEHKEYLNRFKDSLAVGGEFSEDYFPEEHGKKLPAEGGWIMLLVSVVVGKETAPGEHKTIRVPHLSIWYAMPTTTNFSKKVGPVEMPMSQAIIHTPDGDVHIWPHEYKIVEDLNKFLEFTEEEGFYIRFLHPETAEFDEHKLFYLRSRGIGEAQAKRLLLPELNNPNYCYFEFHEDYGKVFGEGSGAPFLMPHSHTRRARAKQKNIFRDLKIAGPHPQGKAQGEKP